ncbi:hypothetical protein RI367_002326 [Sorochytrium milnesiophthora]
MSTPEAKTAPVASTARSTGFRSPMMQVVLVSLVCFCTSGMFNAMNSLGGGGKQDHDTANNANVALYATFSIFGALGGAIHNLLGVKLSLVLGALPYCLYSLALWNTVHHDDKNSPAQHLSVAAGALLGIGAGVMWTAQGAIMMSYPTEANKGKYIAIFWAIFNVGPVLGNLMTTALNWSNGSATASDATYITFSVLMLLGSVLGFFIASPSQVIRDDGTPVHLEKERGAMVELRGVLQTFTDRKMLLLVPACLASNWFYTVQFNGLNGDHFSFRTRSFNSIFYWGMQILGALVLGRFLDNAKYTRSHRGFLAAAGVAILTVASWIGFLVFLNVQTRDDKFDLVDSTGAWFGPFVLFALFGLLDAAYQGLAYWIMGAMTNDREQLARYAGFYKGVQSAGAAIAWAADGQWKISATAQAIIAFILLLISFPLIGLILRDLRIREGKQPAAAPTAAATELKQLDAEYKHADA